MLIQTGGTDGESILVVIAGVVVNVCFDDRPPVEPGGSRGSDQGGNKGAPAPSGLGDPREPNIPCDALQTGTKTLFEACAAGSGTACSQLDSANLNDLKSALNTIGDVAPDIISATGGRFTHFSFASSLPLNGGNTTWTDKVEHSTGYNDLAELVDGIAHELIHVGDGASGRARVNIQDVWEKARKFDRNAEGSLHRNIHTRAREVADGCVRH